LSTINNKAVVNLEACDRTIEVTSNEVTTKPIKLRLEKKQDCDIVLVGGRVLFTVEIENQCSTDVHDLTFKDKLHDCLSYVEGSFKVNDVPHHPEFEDDTLKYEIEELKSCETLTITFEVIVTDDCCDGCHIEIERSAPPTIAQPHYNDNHVRGTGVRYATVYVEFPDGTVGSGTVNNGGNWSIDALYRLQYGQTIRAWQVEPDKKPSQIVTVTV